MMYSPFPALGSLKQMSGSLVQVVATVPMDVLPMFTLSTKTVYLAVPDVYPSTTRSRVQLVEMNVHGDALVPNPSELGLVEQLAAQGVASDS